MSRFLIFPSWQADHLTNRSSQPLTGEKSLIMTISTHTARPAAPAFASRRPNVRASAAEALIVRRTYRMSIESDIVERVNRAASKKQIPISDTKQK